MLFFNFDVFQCFFTCFALFSVSIFFGEVLICVGMEHVFRLTHGPRRHDHGLALVMTPSSCLDGASRWWVPVNTHGSLAPSKTGGRGLPRRLTKPPSTTGTRQKHDPHKFSHHGSGATVERLRAMCFQVEPVWLCETQRSLSRASSGRARDVDDDAQQCTLQQIMDASDPQLAKETVEAVNNQHSNGASLRD